MGIKAKRKIYRRGFEKRSRTIVIPHGIKTGEVGTIAGNRLLLIDPRGVISEDDLLQFLEDHIEPEFWPWLAQLKGRKVNAASNETSSS